MGRRGYSCRRGTFLTHLSLSLSFLSLSLSLVSLASLFEVRSRFKRATRSGNGEQETMEKHGRLPLDIASTRKSGHGTGGISILARGIRRAGMKAGVPEVFPEVCFKIIGSTYFHFDYLELKLFRIDSEVDIFVGTSTSSFGFFLWSRS